MRILRRIQKPAVYLLLLLCVAALSFGPAYSADPADKPSLLEKIKTTDKKMNMIPRPKTAETPLSETQMATFEKCSENYEACAEKCLEEVVNDACDAKCKEDLSLCEKDLPKDWKTIK